MEDLIEYMDQKINKQNRINMVIDFGHDITVGSMEMFMHLVFNTDYWVCKFSCNLFFELIKIQDFNANKDKYFVEYYIDEEIKLNISYDIFKEKVKKNIWNDKKIDNFCLGNSIIVPHPKNILIFIFIIIGIIVIVLIFFNICKNTLLKQKKIKKEKENIEENDKE